MTLDADFGGGYQGPAYECRMTYEPVAGRAAHKARKRKIEPPVFTRLAGAGAVGVSTRTRIDSGRREGNTRRQEVRGSRQKSNDCRTAAQHDVAGRLIGNTIA